MVGTLDDIYQSKKGFMGLTQEQKKARYEYLLKKAMPFSISRGYYSPKERYIKNNPHFLELVKLGKELDEEIYDLPGASNYFIEKDFKNQTIKRPILFIDYLKKKGLIVEKKTNKINKSQFIKKIREIKENILDKYIEKEEKYKENLLEVKNFKKEKCQPLKNKDNKKICNANANEINKKIKGKLEKIKEKKKKFKQKTGKLNELSGEELKELLEYLRNK